VDNNKINLRETKCSDMDWITLTSPTSCGRSVGIVRLRTKGHGIIIVFLVFMDWIDLAQDRDPWRDLVNTVMKLRVPHNVGKFLSSCTTGGCSRRAQLHEAS
jgi:hypothetical protein